MADHQNFDCCFCSLALRAPYRKLALRLSEDLAERVPGVPFVVLTDAPKEFCGVDNVIAIRHTHHFGYRPYNDKVFVLEEALKRFSVAIQIDVDTRITQSISEKINKFCLPGIAGCSKGLLEHTKKNNPKDFEKIERIADKLGLRLEGVRWVGEHMFVLRRDNGKEKEFFAMWKKLARYWDIHKLGAKDGTLIGLAAASVGWNISSEHWQDLNACLEHLDIHRQQKPGEIKMFLDKWNYRLRILGVRFFSLADREFYYD